MTTPLLSIQDMHVRYGGIAALRGLDLTIHAGETVMVTGPNGAGKSTLMKAIAGLVKPRQGRIVFDGQLTTGFDGTYLIQYDEDPYLIEGVPAPARGTQERAGTYRASIFTGYNRVRANAYVNWASGIHNLRWQTRFISSVNQTESNSIGLALATKTTTKIPEYWQHDLTYRADLPWDTTLTATVQNIFDEEPPFAIGTQYNYDPSSATPLGRVFAVAVKKRF